MLKFVKLNWIGLLMAIASCMFGSFNYVAARKMSTLVHSSIETMYIGIVSLVVYFIGLICT